MIHGVMYCHTCGISANGERYLGFLPACELWLIHRRSLRCAASILPVHCSYSKLKEGFLSDEPENETRELRFLVIP